RSESMETSHFSQERLHADVHKAVGGSLNLVRELSRISQELEPSVHSEWLLKRALFYSYELNMLVDDSMSERDRLATLNHFFFEEKRFKSLTALASDWYWEQDENFRFTFRSGNAEKSMGMTYDEILGKTRWEREF
ncbi:MAG: hypothetical protein V4760_01345, partial [Bdellovibrionota bacterium]